MKGFKWLIFGAFVASCWALPEISSGGVGTVPPIGSTWPVLHADGGNSDFVPLAGPRDLVPKWHALAGRPTAAVGVLGPEGNVYSTTMDVGPCHLHALDGDGNSLWCSDQVRTSFTAPAVSRDGAVFVSDGVELFRFESDGSLAWRVNATAPALAPVFTRAGFLLVLDSMGLATAYDPADGATLAQLQIPAGVLPRPDPLPGQLLAFVVGAPRIGMDPGLVEYFIDAFFDFNLAVGNNAPAVHPETGRLFIAVSADPDLSAGIFYGIDFTPPADGSPASLDIGCSAPVGLASGTSPAVSADGSRIYAGDSGGFLTAFNADDCSVAWTLELGEESLASPTVGLDGRFFMMVGGKVTAFQDNGTSAEILWQTDILPLALEEGFVFGNFNSVLPLAQNYLYAAGTFRSAGPIPGTAIPTAHFLATLDLEDGSILSLADLGEECDSSPSLGPDGMLYVPTKPLYKAVLKGTALAPFVPPGQAGLYAFEPESFAELTVDGLGAAREFVARAEAALAAEEVETALTELRRAVRQLSVTGENLATAQERGEVSATATLRALPQLSVAQRQLGIALEALDEGHGTSYLALIANGVSAIERALASVQGD